MFNKLKKKNSSKTKSFFPAVDSMRKKSKKNWFISNEAILAKIQKRSSEGDREAYFFYAKIPKETKQNLRAQGYRVWIGIFDRCPYFVVKW